MEYKRKVDKKRIPTCNIMGVNIAAINMEWLVDYLEKNISEIKGDYICVSNVHTTVGAPKQEKWMATHQGKIDGLMLGVGAGFDYYAENIKRAPMWMQKHNLEWVYRLAQDPKRLFKRYWSTNTKFIWNAMIKGK